MAKQPEIASSPTGILTVLSVSPIEDDHRYLEAIIGQSNSTLLRADCVPPAMALLKQHDISVILCERDLKSATWLDMLENIKDLPHTPPLIVTSRLADNRLWAEAMTLGAWDVLAKPFDRSELLRTVNVASLHWYG